jgi:spectrin beta
VTLKKIASLFSFRRQTSRESGYVPANYIKEIEPRVIKKMAKETVMVPETIKVKRKVKKKIQVERKREVEPKRKSPPVSSRLGRNRSK